MALAFVIAAVAAYVVTRAKRRRRARVGWLAPPVPERPMGSARNFAAELGVDPDDAAELDARFAAATSDDTTWRDDVVAARMAPLVRRRVPMRMLEPLPERGAIRIRFADGTTIVAHGTHGGDLGVLAAVMRDRSVRVSSWARADDGLHLALDWPGRRKQLDLVVTGLDQPD